MSTETIFWACALVGSGFFLSKVVLALAFGIDDHSAHGDANIHLHDAHGTEGAFKLFSFYSISAFLMMFGWTGLAAVHQGSLGEGLAIIIGAGVGAVVMWGTAKFFSLMQRLTSRGSSFSIEATKGLKATVYQRIAGGDSHGVIQVVVEGITHEVEAVSDAAIESFTSVDVVGIKDPKTVIVRKSA